jgi:hypothetical protein
VNEQDPYWAELWASAIAIAQIISEDPSLVNGKRIADLGCGLGVAGLTAALQGSLLPTSHLVPPLRKCMILSSSVVCQHVRCTSSRLCPVVFEATHLKSIQHAVTSAYSYMLYRSETRHTH